ncbi:hypothetical protein BD770DRAFT_413937 [Pilaira anomala]|nr:hypothetical protein BD770DRAFT_413937 [Pilaira anomala]
MPLYKKELLKTLSFGSWDEIIDLVNKTPGENKLKYDAVKKKLDALLHQYRDSLKEINISKHTGLGERILTPIEEAANVAIEKDNDFKALTKAEKDTSTNEPSIVIEKMEENLPGQPLAIGFFPLNKKEIWRSQQTFQQEIIALLKQMIDLFGRNKM